MSVEDSYYYQGNLPQCIEQVFTESVFREQLLTHLAEDAEHGLGLVTYSKYKKGG
jgi:hypothetical protein